MARPNCSRSLLMRLKIAFPPQRSFSLDVLARQYAATTAEIGVIEKRIHAWHRSCEESQRLEEIPGIGPIVATALVAEVGDWKAFSSGRNLAAWIGLVPKQHSTGGKDRNDARGIAQMMRVGLYRPVHVKTLRSQKLRMMLTHRKLLQSKAIAIENDLRGTLRNFGLKVGIAGKTKFEARIKELVENLPDLAELVEPMLVVRRTLREQIVILHRRLLAIVRDDEVCRRLMTTPGVGPVVALTYRATVDVPARFRKSKSVGAVFGLTCSKYQSGEIDWSGRISRCGNEMMRTMLYEAAQVMLTRTNKWSWLKAWAMQIARRRGMKKAIVALARRLAVILHRIWVDGTEFRWTREQAVAA